MICLLTQWASASQRQSQCKFQLQAAQIHEGGVRKRFQHANLTAAAEPGTEERYFFSYASSASSHRCSFSYQDSCSSAFQGVWICPTSTRSAYTLVVARQ